VHSELRFCGGAFWRVESLIVDTHCHVDLNKYVRLEELLKQMDAFGVDKAVLTQFYGGNPMVSKGNTDNTYLYDCVRKHPGRLTGAFIVDITAENALSEAEHWAKDCGLPGIRLRGSDLSPGADELAIWRAAADLGLNVSVSGDYSNISGIAAKFPSLRLLMEHGGRPGKSGDKVFELSKFANVYLKFTTRAVYEISHESYPHNDAKPFFRRIHSEFGPERIMWGSDYPQTEEGYEKSLGWIKNEVDWLSPNDKEWILGKTAAKVWKF
jgi:L-fuconolactonase